MSNRVVLVIDGVVSQEFNWIIDPEDWFGLHWTMWGYMA